jgi:hypothetical protein
MIGLSWAIMVVNGPREVAAVAFEALRLTTGKLKERLKPLIPAGRWPFAHGCTGGDGEIAKYVRRHLRALGATPFAFVESFL